jgi:hypothetical protein
MPRFKSVDGQRIQLSDAEESARDSEEKLWADGAVKRKATSEIARLESLITPRRMRDSVLTADGKTWLDDQEKLIAVERAKL